MTGAWGFIATVVRHMGEEQGLGYLRRLAKQEIVPLPIATRAVLDRVIAGEYAIGLEMVNAHAAISSALGAPVRWVPLDAVTTTLQVAGVTAGAPHPNAGQLFLSDVQFHYRRSTAYPKCSRRSPRDRFANAATITPDLIDKGIDILRSDNTVDSAVTTSVYNMWSPLRARWGSRACSSE